MYYYYALGCMCNVFCAREHRFVRVRGMIALTMGANKIYNFCSVCTCQQFN